MTEPGRGPSSRMVVDKSKAPADPRDDRFCVCGAERGHWGWWWPYCIEKATKGSTHA